MAPKPTGGCTTRNMTNSIRAARRRCLGAGGRAIAEGRRGLPRVAWGAGLQSAGANGGRVGCAHRGAVSPVVPPVIDSPYH